VFAAAVAAAAMAALALPGAALAATPPPYVGQFGSSGSGNGQFNEPVAAAVDFVSGDVYVVDSGNNRIEKFDPFGHYLSQFGTSGSGNGQFNDPAGVALDPSTGDVYVTDSDNNRVEKFDSNGRYLSQFGTSGTGNGQFDTPFGVAVDPRGDVYVADLRNNRVEKFDSSGHYLSQFGTFGSGNGQFDGPTGLTVEAFTNVQVLVADTGNSRVEKFDSSGNYLSQFGSSGSGNGQLDGPTGVAVDPNGNFDVTDQLNDRVEQFDSSGNYLSQFGSIGTGNGQFENPFGVAVDESTGDVYIADMPNNRVEKFGTASPSTLTAYPQLALFPPPNGVGVGTVAATLISGGSPAVGAHVLFSAGGTALCTATTDASGKASCSPSPQGELAVLLSNSYTATFNGYFLWERATTSTPAIELGNGLRPVFSVRDTHGVVGILTRNGTLYALITARTRHGRLSLRIRRERRLRAGRYTLKLTAGGSGRTTTRTIAFG
jgi:DNA-binding beta-propeller fold protein YncE